MTNISPDLTMGKLQEIAHPHRHTIVFANSIGDKDYWQKLWLVHRFVQALGFEERDSP